VLVLLFVGLGSWLIYLATTLVIGVDTGGAMGIEKGLIGKEDINFGPDTFWRR